MRSAIRVLLVCVLVAVSCWAQKISVPSTPVFLRLSFRSAFAVVNPEEKDFTQICISIASSGHYQMRRSRANGAVEGWQGTLSSTELNRLERLLSGREVRGLSGFSGGLMRNSAATFIAEVQREKNVQRFGLSDTDGKKPFPRSVSQIVSWLQGFEAKGAERLDVDTPDICPGGALQPVRPVTAQLRDGRSGSCASR